MKDKKRSWRRWEPYLLLAPGLILIILLMGYPLLYSVRLSFLNYNLLTPNDIAFCGLQNFKKLFTSPDLLLIIKNSLVWVIVVVTMQFLLGFALALLLNGHFRGKGLYQSVVFLPWAVSGFLIGLIFKWLFSQHNGVINYALQALGIIEQPLSWLGSESFSMLVPIVGMIWYGVPFFGIMILAALQSIPGDVLESARIDGASSVQTFLKIVLPYVRPTITVTLLLRVIWVFNSPDIIYITTAGGPANASNIFPLYVFNQAYYSMDFGYGAAAGIVMMLVLVLYALGYLKVTSYEKAGDF